MPEQVPAPAENSTDAREDPASTLAWSSAGGPFPPIGLAVRQLRPDVRHVGIVYRQNGNDTRILHLMGPDDVRDDTIPPHYLVGPLLNVRFKSGGRITSRLARALGYHCGLIAQRYVGEKFPFAMTYNGSRFTSNGEVEWETGDKGFTCSTFVLAFFGSYGFELLERTEWPTREEDLQAQRDMLRAASDAGGHVGAAESDSLSPQRYRPEEVAAAACTDHLPLGYENAYTIGLAICRRLTSPPAAEPKG